MTVNLSDPKRRKLLDPPLPIPMYKHVHRNGRGRGKSGAREPSLPHPKQMLQGVQNAFPTLTAGFPLRTVPRPATARSYCTHFFLTHALTISGISCDPKPICAEKVMFNYSLPSLKAQMVGRSFIDLIHPNDAYPILGMPVIRSMHRSSGPNHWYWMLLVCNGHLHQYQNAYVVAKLTSFGLSAALDLDGSSAIIWDVAVFPIS